MVSIFCPTFKPSCDNMLSIRSGEKCTCSSLSFALMNQIYSLDHVQQVLSYQTQLATVTLSSTWCRTATTETGWPDSSSLTRWSLSSEPTASPVSSPGQELRPCTRVSNHHRILSLESLDSFLFKGTGRCVQMFDWFCVSDYSKQLSTASI